MDNPGQEECEAEPSAGPHAWATMCGGEEDSGTAVMCPGYTGSPLLCPEGEEMVLAGLQSFTYSCGTQAESSSLIGPGPSRLSSDWLRSMS